MGKQASKCLPSIKSQYNDLWPAKTTAASEEQREESKENRIMSNKGDIAADEGASSHVIKTAATSANDNGNGQQEAKRNPNLFLPEPIDLAATGI